jgi:uncharacterized membrane protein
MNWLIAAVAFWIALHVGVAGSPLRRALIAGIGDNGYRILFSALSALGIIWLARAYGAATTPETFFGLRVVDDWMLWVPAVIMPLALVLFVGAVTVKNPTAVGGADALREGEPARGILRITRHPMLWAFTLWAAAHLIANGDLASTLMFPAIIVVSVAGMFSIDRKRRREAGADWERFERATSILPFAAIMAGRNRFVFEEIGLWRVLVALAAWAVLVALHPMVLGLAALPI